MNVTIGSIVYKDTAYTSKAAVVRAMYAAGELDNSPEQKKRVANLLGMTVQTVHATIIKILVDKRVQELGGIPTPKSTTRPQVIKVVDHAKDIRDAIQNRYDECYDIAKAKGYDLPKIPIHWNLKGMVAGQFCSRYGGCFFKVNVELARANMDDYLRQTVPHEFAHYIVRKSFNHEYFYNRPTAHGHEWKSVMVKVFSLAPKRCHNYDVSQVAQRRGRYEYTCGCKTFKLGPVRHFRLRRDPKHYWCPRCNGYLTFVKAL